MVNFHGPCIPPSSPSPSLTSYRRSCIVLLQPPSYSPSDHGSRRRCSTAVGTSQVERVTSRASRETCSAILASAAQHATSRCSASRPHVVSASRFPYRIEHRNNVDTATLGSPQSRAMRPAPCLETSTSRPLPSALAPLSSGRPSVHVLKRPSISSFVSASCLSSRIVSFIAHSVARVHSDVGCGHVKHST